MEKMITLSEEKWETILDALNLMAGGFDQAYEAAEVYNELKRMLENENCKIV